MSTSRQKPAARPGLMRRLFPAYFSDTPEPPTRVGLLNTGELVLLDASGATQVLSLRTVETIRDTLLRPPTS